MLNILDDLYYVPRNKYVNPDIHFILIDAHYYGPAFSTRGNLACARARGAGPPRTVEHRYLTDLGRYRTLVMRAME